MIVIWRGAGCLALLVGVGLLALAAFVGVGVVLGLAALGGGLLCFAVGSQEGQQGEPSSHLYFIPLHYWGVLFALAGIVLVIWGVFRWVTTGFEFPGLPDLGWIWWLLGAACGGVALLAVAAVAIVAILDVKKKNRVIRDGDHTIAWLVQANEKLLQYGFLDGSALVVISPDVRTGNDERWLASLADRVGELRGRRPEDCHDDDQAFVADLLRNDSYIEGKRDRLPEGFAHGREAYLAHLYVYRDHLPAKRIDHPRLHCAVMWHEPDFLICTRP
jgi:hypothetical protein